MITIPSVLTYKDIVVYPDDADCNLFYCIRTTPRIRVENGIPVFSGVFFTDKADGTMKSTKGLSGALIKFDVNMAISEEEYAQLRKQLKASSVQDQRVRAIKKKNDERLYYRQRVTKNNGDPVAIPDTTGYFIPTVGEIRFGSIDYKEANIELVEEKQGEYVAWSSSGGRCSGFGDNNATFALRLSDVGAAIWYEALQQRSKAISVKYNLKLDVRVPCLEIRIYAASHQSSDITRKVQRIWKNVDKGCTDADVERIDCNYIAQNLIDESVINIEIIQGSADIPQQDINRIRESMVSLLQAKIEEIVKSKIQGMTREQMESSMIEKMTEEINSFAELRFTQDSVFTWEISPNATIMNFMEGVPEGALRRVTTLVDLSGSVVPTADIMVQVAAPWDENPFVTTVRVDLEYVATGEHKSFLMSKDYCKDHWSFHPDRKKLSGKKDDGTVRYTATVWTRDKEQPYVMPTQQTKGHVFVSVGKIGLAEVTFVPHPTISSLSGNNKVTGITVHTRYRTKEERLADEKDAKTGKVQEVKRGMSSDFLISPEKLDGYKYSCNFGQPLEEPLLYQVVYSFKNRPQMVMPEAQYYFTEGIASQVLTPNPFVDSLELDVEVNGKIKQNDHIVSANVEFKYVDEINDFESLASVKLSKDDEWDSASASLILMDKANKKFQYRYTLVMKDDMFQSEWLNGEGENEPIILKAPDMLTIDTGLVGMAGTDYYRAKLDIRFKNENMDRLEFTFDKRECQEIRYWYIPQQFANVELEYSYCFTYWDKRGRQHEISGENAGNLLMIVIPENDEEEQPC